MKKLILILSFATLLLTTGFVNAATFTVDITTDENDTTCASGDCSLREAVRAANATTASDTIVFSASSGTYCLDAAYGSIKITAPLTITGKGSSATVIDANCGTSSGNQIFWVNRIGGSVAFSGLTLTDGNMAGAGGGINISGSTASAVTVTDVIFDSNVSTTSGGGLSCSGSSNSVAVSKSRFYNNSSANGGGLASNSGCAVSVSETEFYENQASSGGGFYCSACSSGSEIHQSLFYNNTSSVSGGGLYFTGSTFQLLNVTVAGNTASTVGGGIRVQSSTLTANALTLADNTASGGAGGGVYAVSSSVLQIKNSIFANNSATSTATHDCYLSTGGSASTFTSYGYNLIDTDTCLYTKTTGDSEEVANASLGALADNGGVTRTLAIGTDSAAYNTGSCTTISGTSLTQDQRGFTRDSSCDIGAFEYLPPSGHISNCLFRRSHGF